LNELSKLNPDEHW